MCDPQNGWYIHYLFDALNNHVKFKLKQKRIQKAQFAVYIFDTPVTLKQSQGHHTYNESVDCKQGYNHVKFERSCFNLMVSNKKPMLKFFQMRKYVNYPLWTYVKIKSKIVV